ncbi:hypothetical protein WBJ53_31980 [Spirosoma sp. SC4-14]|uniref:hypothetical protein n=1 Tax=Spirosoma sp. SC4-14 TaxID=3128900 RepID=UPI0030CE1B73
MNLRLVNIVFLLLFFGCSSVSPQSDSKVNDGLIVRTGTSFGMCVGYCRNDYEIKQTAVTLTRNDIRKSLTQTCQTTISETDWAAIKAATNFSEFSKQPERLGCPDCADGGAEYIELQLNDQSHRVTFEYNATIPGFESLVDLLRKQRNAYKECK